MPSASEARAGEAGPCQGQRGQHHHHPGHPFWEMPAGGWGGSLWTGWQLWSGQLPAARGHAQTTPPLCSPARPPGRATGQSPGGRSPSPPCRCAQMPLQGQRGPAPASPAAPTRCLHSAARAARQAPSFSTLFRAPLFPSCPRMSRVDLRNYLERIYNVPVAAVRTRVQHGGSWGRASSPSSAGQAASLTGLAPVSPSSTWSFACEETGPPRGRGALLPRAGTWRPGSRRLLRAGPPPDAPTLASVSKVLMLLCWAFLIPSC